MKTAIQDNKTPKEHMRDVYAALLFICLFTSLAQLKLSCNHEYINEAARKMHTGAPLK